MEVQTWTDDRVAELTRLYAEGFSCRDIGAQLGIGRNAVIGKIHRLDLPTPETKKPIIRQGREIRPAGTITRITRVNRNSNAMRIFTSTETELRRLRCVEIVPRNVSLVDLEPNDCRYPSEDAPFTFCGHPKREGYSYCPAHAALCSEPPRAPIFRFAGVKERVAA